MTSHPGVKDKMEASGRFKEPRLIFENVISLCSTTYVTKDFKRRNSVFFQVLMVWIVAILMALEYESDGYVPTGEPKHGHSM